MLTGGAGSLRATDMVESSVWARDAMTSELFTSFFFFPSVDVGERGRSVPVAILPSLLRAS